MLYKVNIHYEGCCQFDVDAGSEEEAEEKAEAAFANLRPEELVDNLADSFVDDCYEIEDEDDEDSDLTICGEHGCDGCVFRYATNTDLCLEEARKKGLIK